jgi:preprotein translocase subunit SecE
VTANAQSSAASVALARPCPPARLSAPTCPARSTTPRPTPTSSTPRSSPAGTPETELPDSAATEADDNELAPLAAPPGGDGGDGAGAGGRGGGGGDGDRASGAPLRGGNRALAFLRASWAELQRVQWPDRRQVTQATAVVLGFVAIAGAYLGLADYVAKEIVEFIL